MLLGFSEANRIDRPAADRKYPPISLANQRGNRDRDRKRHRVDSALLDHCLVELGARRESAPLPQPLQYHLGRPTLLLPVRRRLGQTEIVALLTVKRRRLDQEL